MSHRKRGVAVQQGVSFKLRHSAEMPLASEVTLTPLPSSKRSGNEAIHSPTENSVTHRQAQIRARKLQLYQILLQVNMKAEAVTYYKAMQV